MTYQEMLNSIPALQKLVGINLPLKQSYAVFRLAKEINSEKDFFVTEEKKLVEKYNGQVSLEGRITFEEPENYEKFATEYSELNSMAAKITEALPIIISVDKVENAELSPMELMTLDGIVNFE